MSGRPLPPIPEPDEPAGYWSAFVAVAVAVAAAAAATAVRLRLLAVPLERDEGEYAYAGRLLLEGVPPFESIYGMKLPGTHLAYGLAFSLLGPGPVAVRLLLVAVNLASTALVFLLGRAWLGPAGAAAAAASFSFLSLQTAMLGPFAHATHFVVLPALAGLLVQERALRAPSGRRTAATVATGLLLGMAILAKQPGVVFLLFALVRLATARTGDRGALVREAAAMLTAAALPTAIVLGWAAARGGLGHYASWLFRYGAGYAKPLPLDQGALWLRVALARIFAQAPLLWGLAGVGMLFAVLPRGGVPNGRRLIALAAFSFLGVCPGLTFREHYFLLALPAVALLVGASAEVASRWMRGRGGPAATLAAPAVIVLLACAQSGVAQRDVLLSLPPDQVARVLYGDNLFPESPAIARWIAERTASGDRIAVFGSEPQIPFLAGRRSATGHVYMYPLLEPQPDARAMQVEMMREVSAARPEFVVSVRVPTSWVRREDSDVRVLEEMAAFLRDGYDPCGVVVAGADGRSRILWESDAASVNGAEGVLAVVLRRRDGTGG